MTTTTAIVFGATGDVGSAVALRARQLGLAVALATRSLTKPIPGLDIKLEQSLGFTRVEADLTQPATVYDAVVRAKANRAFIYMAYGTSDHMRSSISALKSAGIEFLVLLSSHGVQGDKRAILPSNYIPWSNAQVEIVLEEIMGSNGFVALRPAYFASNTLWWKSMIRERIVKTAYPDLQFDWISPKDVGYVGAALLAKSATVSSDVLYSNFVYLCGPELLSQRDAVLAVGQALDTAIDVVSVTEDEHVQAIREGGEPEEVARSSVEMMSIRHQQGPRDPTYSAPFYEM
ncbi:unnamed protein product [Clonostachys byssicola]|uniref:NmrA-like domain-containing protein n=1 Tax=Clonostachys byssicola TaxID=160290 RepID=A0A9N9UGF5_9HYPO|nr:unnamed protein product [Clonostachys byssicola]